MKDLDMSRNVHGELVSLRNTYTMPTNMPGTVPNALKTLTTLPRTL